MQSCVFQCSRSRSNVHAHVSIHPLYMLPINWLHQLPLFSILSGQSWWTPMFRPILVSPCLGQHWAPIVWPTYTRYTLRSEVTFAWRRKECCMAQRHQYRLFCQTDPKFASKWPEKVTKMVRTAMTDKRNLQQMIIRAAKRNENIRIQFTERNRDLSKYCQLESCFLAAVTLAF